MNKATVKKEPTPSATPLKPVEILLLAFWFGLIMGLAEVAVWAVQTALLGRLVVTSHHIIWMAPLINLLYLVGPALILALIAGRWPGRISLGLVIFVFTLPGFLALLFMIPGLHRLAAGVLAAGLSVQTARMLAVRPRLLQTLMRYSTGLPGLLVKSLRQAEIRPAQNENILTSRRQFLVGSGATMAGLLAGTYGWDILKERRALAKLPALSPDQPNVLLIVLDTVRAQNLSLHGYGRATSPTLEQLARQGITFERAISTAPWTLPSHAGIFTGRWHHEVSADMNTPLDATYPTLAEVLATHGYLTAGFIANIDFCSSPYGLNRGFAYFDDFPVSPGQAILTSSLGQTISRNKRLRSLFNYHDVLNRKDAARITGNFLDWHVRQEQRPFFAFLNYYDAHQPYLPPEPFAHKFGAAQPRANLAYYTNSAEFDEAWQLSPEQIQAELAAYDGAIAYQDYYLSLLFEVLNRRGVLDNTLVIITSDHGEQFGEHNLFGHTNSLYMPTLHVPLLVLLPGRTLADQRVSTAVSLRNLPATVLDLVGLGQNNQFPGISLAQYWQGAGSNPASDPILSEMNQRSVPVQDWYPLAKGNMKSLVMDQYHYIRNGDGQEELYDYVNDPSELNDLAGSEAGRQSLSQFRTSLEAILA
jgi:arylsulfatase A-like enzyme